MPNTTPEMLAKRKAERETRFPSFGQSAGTKTPEIRLKNLEDNLFGPNYKSPREQEISEPITEPAMLKPRGRAAKRKHYCFKPPRP